MDFRVETFMTACEYLNFTKTAEVLHITQPAVTQHIHFLEEQYQTKLFVYEGRKLRLSESGVMLYRASVTMRHDELHLKEQIRELKDGKPRLDIGATKTVGEYILPGPLSAYIEKHPKVILNLRVENTRELLRLLDQGIIGCALIEGFFDKSAYDSLVLRREDFIGVCGGGHRLLGRPVDLEDLFCERLFVRENGSGTREVLNRYLENRNFTWKEFSKVSEISDIQAIKTFVQAGQGITFLYRAAVGAELSDGRLCELTIREFEVSHDLTFIWQKGSAFEMYYRDLFLELQKMSGDAV